MVISSNVDLSLTVQLKALAVVQRRNEVENPDVLKRRKQEAIQRRVEESLAGSDCNKGKGVF